MPTQQEPITATADFVLTTGTIDIDGVRIRAATVLNVTPDASEASSFVEIGIMTGGTTQGNRVTLLASGYVGEINPIVWHGDFTGGPNEFLYANIRSSAADSFRLTILSEVT